MKIIYNDYIPAKGMKLLNLWGVLFARNGSSPITEQDKNHERIHTRQIIECTLVVLMIVLGAIALGTSWWWFPLVLAGYYLPYFISWAVVGFRYKGICFEREAYDHQSDPGYLSRRKPFSWLKYVRKTEK